ncbi:MAG: hypothetical protein EXR98_16260 [Gemmataceae bacterium]|nr:hypothetical protein [Gemmataceae bacterium]
MAAEKKTMSAVEFARFLFRAHYANCFWHLKPDLAVTEEMIPLVIKGLRTHGGRREFQAAAELAEMTRK